MLCLEFVPNDTKLISQHLTASLPSTRSHFHLLFRVGVWEYQDHNEYSGSKPSGRPINRYKLVYTANHRTSGLTLEVDSQPFLPYTTSNALSLHKGNQPAMGAHVHILSAAIIQL